MVWMYLSKVKSFRTLAIASTPAAIFTLVEPIVLGLPIAFNAFLIIPFVLSTTLATIFSYLTIQAGIFAGFYVGLPWFTPPPILAVGDSGGHWENLIMLLINFGIGVLIYWPFFKVYEKKVMEEANPLIAEKDAK
jgi:PTS system cellobiose-specific IIC component